MSPLAKALLILAVGHATGPHAAASQGAVAGSPTLGIGPVLPMVVEVQRVVLDTVGGIEIGGGFGSSMARDPAHPDQFYLLSDRGPNVDRPNPDEKGFAIPGYAPRIGLFRLSGDSLGLVSTVVIQDETGKPLSGLPNPDGAGGTGEVPVTIDGLPLQLDPRGLDPEGLVALPDGTFWISDEYGPYLIHLASGGRSLERLSPLADPPRSLPVVLARRRPNRGMEGLAYVPETRTLVGLMQSPLDNPKAAGRRSLATRLVSVDPRSGETHQYMYLLDSPENWTSEIAWVAGSTFLVLEFNGIRPRDALQPSTIMRVYRVDLAGATDVSDPDNHAQGRLFGGKTLEELTTAELQAAGIRSLSKILAADLLAAEYSYRHDKPEGLVVIGDSIVAISNDDDFGIRSDGKGGMAPKRTASGKVDRGEVLFIRTSY